jgi:hypothetical protein
MKYEDSNLINLCSLTEREIKGYNFEAKVDNILRQSSIIYNGNPLNNVYEWKRRQGKGSDFKIPQWNWEMEAKSSNGKVFPSWIIRDWIPRFKKNSFKVTIYNETMKLPSKSLELCFNHDIYLVSIDMLGYVLKTEKKRREGNKLIEANRTNKRKGNKLVEVNNKVIEPSKANNNTNNNVNNSNISNSKVENDSEDNISECIGSINERKRIKGYVTFTLDEIKEYVRIKNEYISNNIEEPKLYHVLYGKILRYAIYNWTNLCRFCRNYPCDYLQHYNGVRDGNFYLLKDTDQSQVYMNVINKIHKCLRKKLYLFFFRNYTYFNIPEDRTANEIKNPQTTITDYMGGTV